MAARKSRKKGRKRYGRSQDRRQFWKAIVGFTQDEKFDDIYEQHRRQKADALLALYVSILDALAVRQCDDGKLQLDARTSRLLRTKRTDAFQRNLEALESAGLVELCTDCARTVSVVVTKWPEVQGFALSTLYSLLPPDSEANSLEKNRRVLATGEPPPGSQPDLFGGFDLPELESAGTADDGQLSRVFDVRELPGDLPMGFPETFPAWPLRWYRVQWARLFRWHVAQRREPKVDYRDGSMTTIPGWYTSLGWLASRWPSIEAWVDDRGTGAYKATATTWYGRMISGLANGDPRSESELLESVEAAYQVMPRKMLNDAATLTKRQWVEETR